jgi:hypothetical protein
VAPASTDPGLSKSNLELMDDDRYGSARARVPVEANLMSASSLPSPSAKRTRRYRQRRRLGTRCITVEMNDLEISALVTKGYLAGEARNDPNAIKAAIETLVSDLAFELEQQAFRASGSRS